MNRILGIGIISLSIFSYSLLSPLLKKANLSLPPFTVMAISMLSLFVFSLFMSIAFEHSFKLQIGKSSIFLLLLVGIINALGFWLGILGYKYMPLGKQSLFGLLSPIFVSIFAYFILGEKLDPKILVSLLIMGFGLFISFL
jgi:drug/metabolite transporter (DMT)-like permease